MSKYYSSQQAAKILNVKAATLYSYVSRGLLRSEEVVAGQRERKYVAADVDRLRERKEARRNPAKVAERALSWGEPVLSSGLTLIEDGTLYYRGRSVDSLAETVPFGDVANLLWRGDLAAYPPIARHHFPQIWRNMRAALAPWPAFARMQVALPILAQQDKRAFDLRPEQVPILGAKILHSLTAVAVNAESVSAENIPTQLQQAWAPDLVSAEKLINAALILSADHELNASSFTARVVAGVHANLYQVVQAGLAAISGVRHGAATARAQALLATVATPADAEATMVARLQRGEPMYGFGHHLYPDGDPRAKVLLQLCRDALPAHVAVQKVDATVAAVYDLTGLRPTIDIGLVAVAQALGLPAGSPLTLFAIGRTVGWIAHAIEQFASDSLIRPRANYTGERPQFDDV